MALKTVLGELRVVSAEGLIGFKLQGLANDPRRTQDLEDIRALLRANRSTLRECASIFVSSTESRYSMSSLPKSAEPPFAAEGGLPASYRLEEDPYRTLDDLMAAVEALCPVWPRREVFAEGGRMLIFLL